MMMDEGHRFNSCCENKRMAHNAFYNPATSLTGLMFLGKLV